MTTDSEAAFNTLIAELRAGVHGGWRKAVLSQPATGVEWRRAVATPVRLKGGPAIKLVLEQGDAQRTSTVAAADWEARLEGLLADGPGHINVMGDRHDWHGRRAKSGRWLVTRAKPSLARGESSADAMLPGHDREVRHALREDDPLVQELFVETGLFGLNGKLRGEAADKYRQVHHYIELLRPLAVLASPAPGRRLRIVDAGCGKAYLSLALLLYARQQGFEATLIGVDRNEGVIATVQQISAALGLGGAAQFEAKAIGEFATGAEPADLLVSLHACDTASDEALAAGVRLQAESIVLAPCCHHELVAQIERQSRDGSLAVEAQWGVVTGSGLLRHRLADLITDGLRAAALEACGYRVDVLEFISADATAKNVMIRAEKRRGAGGTQAARERGLQRYRALRDAWGVRPAVGQLVGGDLAL